MALNKIFNILVYFLSMANFVIDAPISQFKTKNNVRNKLSLKQRII